MVLTTRFVLLLRYQRYYCFANETKSKYVTYYYLDFSVDSEQSRQQPTGKNMI
jgi:hypothetical protein